MKKKQLVASILLVMRITMLQIAIAIVFAGGLYANRLSAQEILDKRVTISAQNTEIRKIISKIQKQTGVKFIYSPNTIGAYRKISCTANEKRLGEFIESILVPLQIGYKIVDNQLLLYSLSDETISPGTPEENRMSPTPAALVTGRITNENEEPMGGVSVVVKGASLGTSSNEKGEFKIEVASENAILVFSHTGYITQEHVVGKNGQLDIRLTAANKAMEDVIVVGYGTQKKATLTGAVEQVSSKEFESRAVTNPALALQGETPGLVVTRTSSRPGNEAINFQIRGVTSVNGGSPLVVIDGIPASTSNAFFTMNPDDIESVSILKDGMAAIYGSRAANGVILVTTKRGKGRMKIDYNLNTRSNTIGIRTPSPSMQQYATMWIEANKEETVPNYWGWKSLDNLQKMQQGSEGIYSTQYWGDIFIGKANRFDELFATRLSQQHNLAISGASDKTAYRLSAGYADNRGNLATSYDGLKQYDLKLNYDYTISDRIKLQSGITYQKDITSSPSGGLGFDMIAEDPPFFPARNPYGQWYANFGTAGNRNSTASTTDGGRDIRGNDLIRIDMKGTVELLKGLELEGTGSIQSNHYRWDNYNLTVPLYEWDGTLAPSSINPTSDIRAESDNNFYQNYTALLRYSRQLGDHHITAMGGINAEKNDFKGLYAYRTGIGSYGVYDLNAAPTSYVEGTGGQNHWGFYSYIGRVNYSYQDKYLLEVLGRRDGSSRFAPGYQWSNFYNVSGGWVMTHEKFIERLGIKALDLLKLRASYGETGNQVGIGLYDYISAVNLGTAIFGSTAANQTAASLNGSGLTSNTRTWERVAMMNLGIDMGFLNNRLTAQFDYYKKRNNGMLVNVTYPSVLGGTAPQSNSGVLDVHGWEAILGWHDKIGAVSYNIAFNVSDSRNKLRSMEGATTWNAGKVNAIVGYPLNSWFMYATNGYFKNQADVDAYYAKYTGTTQGEVPGQTDQTLNLRPGDTKKVDLDGNGYISAIGDPTKGNKGDVKYMGDAAPHYIFGVHLGASWKGIDVSTFFQGVANQYLERDGTLEYPFWAVWTNSNTSYLGKTWTTANPNAQYPRLTVNNVRAQWNYLHNDFMLRNNRYIRMKSLIIGYTVPKSLYRKLKIDRVRAYFSGNDLFEFASIKDGFDPEQSSTSQNNGYPFMRTWAFGLNLGF